MDPKQLALAHFDKAILAGFAVWAGLAVTGLFQKPADLTMVTVRYGRFPEDRVFETIAGIDMPEGHGTREMPSWGDVFVSEGVGSSTKLEDAMNASDEASRRIAGLMRYIESIQATQ